MGNGQLRRHIGDANLAGWGGGINGILCCFGVYNRLCKMPKILTIGPIYIYIYIYTRVLS